MKPALTIDSGDIIDVDTMLTNTPDRPRALRRAADDDASVAARDRRPGTSDRGPGGHILTGPVYVERRRDRRRARSEDPLDRSADRLRLQRLQRIRPGELRTGPRPRRSFSSIARTMTATFLPGIVIPLRPFFGSMGVAPARGTRARQQQPAGHARRQPGQQGAGRGHDVVHSGVRAAARCSRSATATRRKATAKSIRPRSKPRCAASCS